MDENQNIYALFNFINDSPIWIGLLNTLLSIFLGAWIVYRFNIKVENKKFNENRKLEFENLKYKIGKTLEEFRMIGSYITEYQSKGEFQIAQRELTDYFNENLYNIRISNFDIFRIKYAELRSVLLYELKELNKYVIKDEFFETLVMNVEKYNIPPTILFNKDNILNSDNELISEQEIDSMVIEKLKEENELIYFVIKFNEILPNLKYKE